jgi:hypothetical protein
MLIGVFLSAMMVCLGGSLFCMPGPVSPLIDVFFAICFWGFLGPFLFGYVYIITILIVYFAFLRKGMEEARLTGLVGYHSR